MSNNEKTGSGIAWKIGVLLLVIGIPAAIGAVLTIQDQARELKRQREASEKAMDRMHEKSRSDAEDRISNAKD